jgi:hypothetical protein
LRALAGPAIYGGSGASALGVQLSVDAAGGVSHAAVVAAARAGLVAPLSGEPLVLGSLELGLRFR